MKQISLTQDQRAVVDDDYFDWLTQWKWHAHWDENNQSFYAVRRTREENGKRGRVFMHRLILGLDQGDKRKGDHISRCTLDNRRINLRIATSSQNAVNSKVRSDCKSGCKGVSFQRGKWRASIGGKKARRHLGTFSTREDAALAYNVAAQELYGEFASLNVICIKP